MKGTFINCHPDHDMVVTETATTMVVAWVKPAQTVAVDCPGGITVQAWDSYGVYEDGTAYDFTIPDGNYITLFTMDAGGAVLGHYQYRGIASTVEVPALGTITLPSWASDSPELALFFFGFATAAGVRMIRAALRWFKRADGYADVTD